MFRSSTVILDGMIVHLVYIVEGSVLFLIGAPSIWLISLSIFLFFLF
jgi:hypothetical protein